MKNAAAAMNWAIANGVNGLSSLRDGICSCSLAAGGVQPLPSMRWLDRR